MLPAAEKIVEAIEPPAAIELTPATLRRRFANAFQPRPAIYWADMLGSASVGWTAFALSGFVSGPLGALALAVATLGLYRAVLFIHELAHLRRNEIPGFEIVWNVLVGFPLAVPSVMYVGSHRDHHNRAIYGTAADPEYEAIAHWSPLRIAASMATMLVLPPALALRWGVLGPLSWLIPPMRRIVVASLSTLVINPAYQRRIAPGATRRWAACEIGGAIYFWVVALGLATGRFPFAWAGRWYLVGCGILVLNHLRTLAAHRYENRGAGLDMLEQVADSVNLSGMPGLTALAAPVGLRYHGLHHLLPTLPYHNLGRVQRELLAELPADSPYRETERATLIGALSDLMARAARNARARAS